MTLVQSGISMCVINHLTTNTSWLTAEEPAYKAGDCVPHHTVSIVMLIATHIHLGERLSLKVVT